MSQNHNNQERTAMHLIRPDTLENVGLINKYMQTIEGTHCTGYC